MKKNFELCAGVHNFSPARQIKNPLENGYLRRPKVKMLKSFFWEENAIDMRVKNEIILWYENHSFSFWNSLNCSINNEFFFGNV